MKKNHKIWTIILCFAALKLAIHLILSTNYGLQRDAYLYYSLGQNLAWGYVSVPPLIAVLARISTAVLGNTVFALRLLPALIGSISVIIIGKIVLELEGKKMAVMIALTAFTCTTSFLRSNTLFQPVSFNQFFWLLSLYFVIRLIKTQNPLYWIYIFTVWGIGFLNKYSIAFIILATLFAILLTPYRRLFSSKYFYIGGILSILIILPNLFWQYAHNWPVIPHMAELQKNQLVNVKISSFLLDQLTMNLPALIVWVSGLIGLLFMRSLKKYRTIAYIYFFTVLIIILLKGKSYYTLGLYSTLFAFGGYSIDKFFTSGIKYAVLIIIVLLAIPMLPISLPLLSQQKVAEYTRPIAPFTNRWEDGKIHNIPQDYADMTGWKELSSIVIRHFNSLTEQEQNKCWIFTDNYGQAGAIYFYGKQAGLPRPISFSDNFILWAPDSVKASSVIYVNDQKGDITLLFDQIDKIGQVNNKYFREDGLKIFFCTEPVDTFNQFYRKKVSRQKGKYQKF